MSVVEWSTEAALVSSWPTLVTSAAVMENSPMLDLIIHRAISQSLLRSPFGQIRPPRKDSTNERLAFHKAKPRGANVLTVTGAY